MNDRGADPIAEFYDRHPYPPPVADLDAVAARTDVDGARVAHHLIWPHRSPSTIASILVAGCGTSQAARIALRHPDARVVGIDVSATSIEHTRRLAARHDIGNLTVEQLPIERAGTLDRQFDHVLATGVIHHLADPVGGLRALRDVLAPGGAVTLMVYAPYGRTGVYLMQEYCRRLGLEATPADIADLVDALRELPTGHPLSRLLRETRDFRDDDALADALLNPRDRAYSVPELFDLLAAAGLRFGRWQRQAPYLPDCGTISETPHAPRLAALPPAEQYAAVELFRGTLDRHTVIAFADDDPTGGRVDPSHPASVPIVVPTATVVDDRSRLPHGVAAALINRAHPANDLVLFVDEPELRTFRALDGETSVAELSTWGTGTDVGGFVRRCWRHDLVVVDATRHRDDDRDQDPT